jgi:predicted Zn-dependent protease with MMP-like domain
MQVPTDDEFDDLVSHALDSLPQKYTSKLVGSVAIVYADEPTLQQREQLKLRGDQTLLGLYEGVPLPARGGMTKLLPDKTTLFKIPLAYSSLDHEALQENVRHTLWHEMAHYYGLDHKRIHELE